jgi:transposase
MKVTVIGIDLAKSVFQVCGVNQAGTPAFNHQVRRHRLMEKLLHYPQATIVMEACSGSNFWGRKLREHGFKALLIPPQHVKPFVKGNKNDRNDAFAITEAARRPNMRFVEPRSLEQTDIMIIHKLLDRKVKARTALINQIRGFLNEYGIVISSGKERLLKALPELLEAADNGLTVSAREVLHSLWEEWRDTNRQIQTQEATLKRLARHIEPAQRLMAVKGVAEKTATAVVAYAGDGKAFSSGRHFAANLGLVPQEHSSGGKQLLGRITRRGNSYLRRLLVQGAWSVIRYVDRASDRLSRWAKKVMERRGKHKAVIAVAHKLARILWAMLYHQTEYRAM